MKKRLLTLAVSFLCTLFAFAQFSGSGSGTASDPYLIFNPVQLNQLRNFLNKTNVYFKLMNNIDLTEFLEDENPTQGWKPIGSSSSSFRGIVDGNGKTISGLWVNRSSESYVGLFGYIKGATIKNLNIVGNSVIGKERVGGLCGYASSSNISGSSYIGTVKGDSYIGGFFGECSGATLSNLSGEVVVNGSNDVGNGSKGLRIGGIVGSTSDSIEISNCRISNSIISGRIYLGGAIGYADGNKMNINNCFIYSDISGRSYVGGLCGLWKTASNISTKYSIGSSGFWGNINGDYNIGGLVGRMNACSITNCFSISDIIASGNYVGGICGDTGEVESGSYCNANSYSINNTYHSGSISSNGQYVGGIVGKTASGYGKIIKCYAWGDVSGNNYVGGLVGYGYVITLKRSIAICDRISGKGSNVHRIVGSYEYNSSSGLATPGTTDENKSYNRTIVVCGNMPQEILDSNFEGTGVSATTLKLKATYVSMGFDFVNTWEIQETECYPYMKCQTAPPIVDTSSSTLVSGQTTISGKAVDGGTVYIDVDGDKQETVSSGYIWSFTVNPLQAGKTVRVFAKANGKEQSYPTTEPVYFLGKGTETNPYQIYTADDLSAVAYKGYYILMNDIDLTTWINTNSPTEGWIPIGRNGCESIHFNGNGHKISGLWLNTPNDITNKNGLFSSLYASSIQNLQVEVADNKQVEGGNGTGILIGMMTEGVIENCTVKGSLTGDSRANGVYVGGLVGRLEGGSISRCTANVFINNVINTQRTLYVGGIAGWLSGTINYSNASVSINTTGQGESESYVGGIVGVINGTLEESFSYGDISATGASSYAAGIAAKSESNSNITNCYSTAGITSSYCSAGIVGYNYGKVMRCYASGDIISNNYGAGIIGYNDGANASVAECVAFNNVINVTYESQSSEGGGYGQRIIGGYKNGAPNPEMNNYALKTMQVSVNNVPQIVYDDLMNGTSKTAEELKQQSTYEELYWNFTSVWSMNATTSMPYLQWETNVNPVVEITLDKTTLLIAVGKDETITASVLPFSATNKQLNWTSSDESVATVENGVVTAVAVGTATITAAATDGSGVTATCQVTVTASKEAAIAALQELVAEAQALYDGSTEGDNIGDYAPGSRAALLAVINSVNAQISSTMSDEAISQCTADITAAIEQFQSQQVTAGEDTDYSTIANTIYLERVEAAAGSQVTLSVKMKNTVEVQGYQFDLYLPDGVTVATDEDGFSLIELSTARTTARKTDYFNSTLQADGSIRVLCGSSKGYTFEGTDGEVATITLNIDENMEEGDHPIILKEVNLTDKNSTLYTTGYLKSTLAIINFMLGDVNGNKKVEVSDFIATANYILGNPPQVFIFKAGDVNSNNKIEVADFIGIANIILNGSGSSNAPAAAPKKALAAYPKKAATDIDALSDAIYVEPVTAAPGTQQVLSVRMKNSSPVAGFEFRLQLPDGITVATDEDGILMAELSTARTTARKTDYFNSSLQADGTLQVLCGTSTADPNTGRPYTFSGNDGEVALITVNIPEDYAEGVYEVSIHDIAFSDDDNNLTEIGQTVTTEMTVGDNSIVLDENSEEDLEATDGPVKVVVKRTLKKDQWSTICLPFDMTEEQVYAAFGDDVQLQEFDSYDPEYDDDDNVTSILVHFTDADLSDGFYGNYPYVIKVSEDISEFTVTATIDPQEDECYTEYAVGRGNKRHVYGTFYGTYHAQTTVPENCLFISGNKFWYSTGLTKMKAFRGYFELEDVLADVTNANISFSFDGTASGISEIRSQSLAEGAVYTLQGQFVGKDVDLKKLPRGIYIINGKKQVVK